jgi:choloylglycine hydrolase
MCTGLFILSEDGNYYQSRTLEFEYIIPWKIFKSDTIIGLNMVDDGITFTDGLNQHGLCCMTFLFKCSYSYNANTEQNKKNLASNEVCGYFLKNAKSIDDVIKLSENINVTNQPMGPPFNCVMPFHWFISDKTGKTIIIETDNGKLLIYDNSKHKVCTNNPTYPKQVELLDELIKNNNFSYCDPSDNMNCGLGKGLIGMPGDYSSISRFQRAYILSSGMSIPAYKSSNIETMFNFNNSFNIVYGSSRNCDINPPYIDFTQYISVYDFTNLTLYVKNYPRQHIVKVGSLNPPSNPPTNSSTNLYTPNLTYLQPISCLGTSNRTFGAVLVGNTSFAGGGGVNRINKFIKNKNIITQGCRI